MIYIRITQKKYCKIQKGQLFFVKFVLHFLFFKLKPFLLTYLLAFMFLLGTASGVLAKNSLPATTPGDEAAASLSQTTLPDHFASLQHQASCEAMTAPIPSLQPLVFQYYRFLLECFFFPCISLRAHQALPRFAQSYFRNLFRLLRVINAP